MSIFDGVGKLIYPGDSPQELENMNLKNAQSNAGETKQQSVNTTPVEGWRETLSFAEEVAENFSLPKLKNPDGKYNLQAIAALFEALFEYSDKLTNSREYYKARYEKLKQEQQALVSYLESNKSLDEFAKWKAAQKAGRPHKTVDWKKYDLLNQAGLTQKEIAQHLGVSPNTLRKLVGER